LNLARKDPFELKIGEQEDVEVVSRKGSLVDNANML